MSRKNVIISLCDYSGAWSQPYVDAGYAVKRIDLKRGDDARLWPSKPSGKARFSSDFDDIRDYIGLVRGVLSAPVCTAFSNAGAKHTRTDDDVREALALVDACIRISMVVDPDFWALENTVGKLVKWLGDPAYTFNPCDFGDPYTKRTLLWGRFNSDLKTNPVEPVEGSKMWAQYGGGSDRTKELRSLTPPGFARAFYEANP